MRVAVPMVAIESILYSYDANGNLLTLQDTTGLTTWHYDELGRALNKTVTGIGQSSFEYDLTIGLPAGYHAEKTTDPLGESTTKVYDKANRLGQVNDAGETIYFEYYDNGSRKSVTYPDGSKEGYLHLKNCLNYTIPFNDAVFVKFTWELVFLSLKVVILVYMKIRSVFFSIYWE